MSHISKTQRQLLLYEILYTSHEATIDDLMRRLNASKKTIQRDIEDLTDAGLDIRFDGMSMKSGILYKDICIR